MNNSIVEKIISERERYKEEELQQPIIELKNLVVDYGTVIAVNNANITIQKGEMVTLLGPSGCGKTTTLNAIAGLLTPTSGSISFSGKDMTAATPQQRKLGLVFQNYALYPHLSVYKNIAFPLTNDKIWKQKVRDNNQRIDFFSIEKGAIRSGISENEAKILTESFDAHVQLKIYFQQKIEFHQARRNKLLKEFKQAIQIEKAHLLKDREEARKIVVEKYKKSSNPQEVKKEYYNSLSIAKQKTTLKIEKLKIAHKKNVQIVKEEITPKIKKLKREASEAISQDNKYLKELKEKFLNQIKLSPEIRGEMDDIKKAKRSINQAIAEAVIETAERVQIVDQLKKRPTELSGGQQQRVAIARALSRRPKIILFDEPLSNLDAKLRHSTRDWIRSIQKELGITGVFVTHDQEEAMAISDKVVCMSNGLIQQIGTPMDLYLNPKNKFVAGFIGTPEMNFFKAENIDGTIFVDKKEVLNGLIKNQKIAEIGIRPEHLEVVKNGPITGTIKAIEKLGKTSLITLSGENGIFRIQENGLTELNYGETISCAPKNGHTFIFNSRGNKIGIL